MKKILIGMAALWILLAGCQRIQEPAVCRVVTQITVTRSDGSRRCYTDQSKMRAVLTYLRGLDPYGAADAPTVGTDTDYRIEVSYSDGNGTIYLQKANRYLQINGQSWQSLDPEKAALLSEIFETTPSD